MLSTCYNLSTQLGFYTLIYHISIDIDYTAYELLYKDAHSSKILSQTSYNIITTKKFLGISYQWIPQPVVREVITNSKIFFVVTKNKHIHISDFNDQFKFQNFHYFIFLQILSYTTVYITYL